MNKNYSILFCGERKTQRKSCLELEILKRPKDSKLLVEKRGKNKTR